MRLIGKLALGLMIALAGLGAGAAAAQAAELLMFDDPACVWCRRWHAEVGPSYPRSDEGRMAPLRRVLIRDQATLGVALSSPIRGTPTFVLVERGREIGRINGYPGADYFYPQLGELLRRLAPAVPEPAPRPPLRSTQGTPIPCAVC